MAEFWNPQAYGHGIGKVVCEFMSAVFGREMQPFAAEDYLVSPHSDGRA